MSKPNQYTVNLILENLVDVETVQEEMRMGCLYGDYDEEVTVTSLETAVKITVVNQDDLKQVHRCLKRLQQDYLIKF